MTVEKAIEILSDVGDINRCCAEDAEALDIAIKALEQQVCDNDCEHCDWATCPKMEEETETITVSKGCLKIRTGRFVVYDVEYLKNHIEQEAAIYGRIAGMKKEHDGCVSCRFEDKKEHEKPCRSCSHNFTDKWRAKE